MTLALYENQQPEFEAAIGALKASLHKLLIPNHDQKELLAVVEEHSTTDRHAKVGVGEEWIVS